MAPELNSLASHASSNSPDHNAKGTQSENSQGEPQGLLLPLVSMWFQDLFHSPHWGAFHLSLTVLVHYRSHRSLSPWRVVPPASRPITRVGRYSGTPLAAFHRRRLPGSHRLWRPVPRDFRWLQCYRPWVLQPPAHKERSLGFGRFRSPLLPASQLIPLPLGTEMFQFPGFALLLREVTALTSSRVAPFGHPRINACVPLPLAYRSLPRPSSPLCAQASSTCYRSLDYKAGSLRIPKDPSLATSILYPSRARATSRTQFSKPFRSLFTSEHSKLCCFRISSLLARVILPSHDLPFVPLSNSTDANTARRRWRRATIEMNEDVRD